MLTGFQDEIQDHRIRIIGASDLSRADGMFTGKSDPYGPSIPFAPLHISYQDYHMLS